MAGPLLARGREGSLSLAVRKRSSRDGCAVELVVWSRVQDLPHRCATLPLLQLWLFNKGDALIPP